MENKRKLCTIYLTIIVIVLLIAGGGIYFYINKKPVNSSPVACTMEAKLCPDGSYVGRTLPNCEFSPCPSDSGKKEFNKPVTMRVNDEVIFVDGLSLTLKGINDSRCPANVQCIWQGEFSASFSVKVASSSEEIRLGTVNNKVIILKNYTFSLKSATKDNIIVIVSKN